MFKRIIIALLMFTFIPTLNLYAEQNNTEKLRFADENISKYQREKSWGIKFLILGTGLEMAGALYYPKALANRYVVDDKGKLVDNGESNINACLVAIGVGAIGMIAGTWMWWEGADGLKIWESKKFDLSMNLSPEIMAHKKSIGLELTAEF